MGRTGAWITTAVRVGTVLLLVGSGGLSYAGSRERWAGACGDWEATACLTMQDHRYDYLVPSDPWTPVGDAALYAGVAYLLLALATLVLPVLLFRGRPLVATLAVGAATALSILPLASATWESAVAGRPVDAVGALPALLWWGVAWPVSLGALALLPRHAGDRPGRGWRVVVVLALVMASPVAQVGYSVGPYDSAPWYEAVAGGMVLVAGCALWPATTRSGRTSRQRAARPAAAPVVQRLGRTDVQPSS